jgi:hypothetical protein
LVTATPPNPAAEPYRSVFVMRMPPLTVEKFKVAAAAAEFA